MLLHTLAAVAHAWDESRDELFLVDNASSDDSLARAGTAFPDAVVIRNRCNNGFARACNQAIARAAGEFILLLNSDAIIAPDVLRRFEASFGRDARIGAMAGQLQDAAGLPQRCCGQAPSVLAELGLGFLAKHRPSTPHDGLIDAETLVGACLAVRAAAIRDAGSIDDDFFFYGEDIEWTCRLHRRGWRVVVNTEARVTHVKGGATRGLRRSAQIEMLCARLQLYRKTFSPATARLLTGYRTLRLAVNTVINLVPVLLTLGLVTSRRNKFSVYLAQLTWLALGKPEHWGLPEKCPRGADPTRNPSA